MAFPDVIEAGVYTPEELGGSVQVIDDQVVPAYQDRARLAAHSDTDLPSPRPIRPREQPDEPLTAAELGRIAHMRRVRALWYGEDETQPAPCSRAEADKAIALLQNLLRLPVPDAGNPATPDQHSLAAEALHDLEAAGDHPASIPTSLTAGHAYTLYKDLVRQRTKRFSIER